VIDDAKNIAFWNNNARRSRPEKGMFAGMLTGTSEFDALYRCRSEQEHFLRIFDPTREMRILEVGSGGGRWGFWLSDRVGEYVGIDISPDMVRIAERERVRRGLSNLRFECSTFPEFYDNGCFDLIYFSGVLQCMDDDAVRQCIAKVGTMLRVDGGDAVIISRDSVSENGRFEKFGDYPAIFRTADEYRQLFESYGYRLDYSALSYLPRRFTGLTARLYRLPFVTYEVAYTFRELLCKLDNDLGNPKYLKRKIGRGVLDSERRVDHKFFRYVKTSANR